MIYYDRNVNEYMCIRVHGLTHIGAVYFATKRIAKDAIKLIVKTFMAEHPDFEF